MAATSAAATRSSTAGTSLGPAQLAALAAAGIGDVRVSRRPTLAVLVTGSELRPPGSTLEPGQIYDANGVMLAAQAARRAPTRTGWPPSPTPPTSTARRWRAGSSTTCSSRQEASPSGPHDLVRSVGAELGVEEVFWGIAMRPGKPLWFGVRERTLVFGLPGNPVSSLVCFQLFVRPALLALQGHAAPRPPFSRGTLRGQWRGTRHGTIWFVPAGRLEATASSSSRSLARSRT